MCLSTVKSDYRKNKNRNFGIGFKVLETNCNGEFCSDYSKKKYNRGIWYTADTKTTVGTRDWSEISQYNTGFHIFLSQQDAISYKDTLIMKYGKASDELHLVRVRYNDVMYLGENEIGYDGNSKGNVVIAKKMFIEKE